MTAEVVIANRLAIALAADSAVTITSTSAADSSDRVRKIFTNADKLFELVRGEPVGVMIYGAADIVATPWETLIKWFRRSRLGQPPAPNMADYVHEFLQFVGSRFDQIFPKQEIARQIHEMIDSFSTEILSQAEAEFLERIADLPAKSRARIRVRREALDAAVDSFMEELETSAQSEWAEGLSAGTVIRDYGADYLLGAVPESFGDYVISKDRRRRLRLASVMAILVSDNIEPHSGLVFAGFGDEDLFPESYTLIIPGALSGRLIVLDPHMETITADQPSFIRPLAQTDDARTFLQGIAPELQDFIQDYWRGWLGTLPRSILRMVTDEIGKIETDQARALLRVVLDYGSTSWSRFADHMNDLHSTNLYGPIQDSVAFLSKPELANLAENIVNLASIRAKVAMNRDETVGGATDVAVISKGDGFIWVKRKHYFRPELNPTWTGRNRPASVGLEQNNPVVRLSGESHDAREE